MYEKEIVYALGYVSVFGHGSRVGLGPADRLEPEYHFVVWLHDGGKVTFSLDAHPVVTHSDGMLVVSAAESRVEYAHSSVRKFTIEEVEEVPEEPEPDPTPEAEHYLVVWPIAVPASVFPLSSIPA